MSKGVKENQPTKAQPWFFFDLLRVVDQLDKLVHFSLGLYSLRRKLRQKMEELLDEFVEIDRRFVDQPGVAPLVPSEAEACPHRVVDVQHAGVAVPRVTVRLYVSFDPLVLREGVLFTVPCP